MIHLLFFDFVAILPSAVDAILSVICGRLLFNELKKTLLIYLVCLPKFLTITFIFLFLSFFIDLPLTNAFLSISEINTFENLYFIILSTQGGFFPM